MISALLLSAASFPANTTLNLYRGSQVGESAYWAVADTNLDSGEPDRAKGGLFTLEGGKGKTVLIKFGDLENRIPIGAKVVSATLYLSPSSTDKPSLTSIASVKAPWGEGPMFAATLGRPAETVPPKGAATWKHRRSGSIEWQQGGAMGPEDTLPITGAQLEIRGNEVAVTGLGPAVQVMSDRWFDNHGFALTFDGRCEFFSSQAKLGKPRLEVQFEPATGTSGADLSVQWLERIGSGDDATYQATVKNVGSEAAKPFSAQWTVMERPGSIFSLNKALAPGEETTVELKKPYRPNSKDPRVQTLQIKVHPSEPEANSRNNALEISEDAIPVGFTGAKVQADALQRLAREINDVYFSQSRFSFALEGAIERIRLVPARERADHVIDLAGLDSDKEILRSLFSMLTGIGTTADVANTSIGGETVVHSDPFSGISGFGDTRNESLIPTGIPMLYVPVASPLFDTLPIEPTTLLSGTEVAALNSGIGLKGAARYSVLWDLPATIILRATDMAGRPLDGAELAFYQLDRGVAPDLPTQTILTKNGGTVILENREAGNGVIDKDAIHSLKKNPFGNLRTDGSNGTILIRALINGESEWSWLKAWQLADSYHRGNKAAAIIDVRFNAPSGPIDRTVNLARGKLVSDKAASLPAKLAPLVDDDLSTKANMGQNAGDWIEIDLGRDRPIGEVLLVPGNAMPTKFDIQTYATGQPAPETEAWVKDLNHAWTRANLANGDQSIPYRGPMTRARFIRIINRSGGPAELAEIRVFALQAE